MNVSIEEQFMSAYDRYADPIFRFCYAQIGQRDVALDLMQETFSRVWKYLADGHLIDEMRPFTYRTARNALIDYTRRPSAQSLDALLASGFDIADNYGIDPHISAQATEAIRHISNLEEPYREVVALRFVDDLMPREIAKIIGENENTVSVRITRGMQKLRESMK